MNSEHLNVGTRYDVAMEDCCVAGRFTAILTVKRYDDKEPDFLAELVFDNGVHLTDDNAVKFTECADSEEQG